jgi:hypothetical protein
VSDYPASLTTKPLTTWPGQLTPWDARKRSPFSAGMRQTLSLLDRELWYLSATGTVLEVAIPAEKFRIDGHPRAGATAEHPGVVLSLPKTSVGPLRYACDRFDKWQDNLRAIALGLEALRRVERYGITRRGEQYQGFKALPGGSTPAPQMSYEQAVSTVAALGGHTAGHPIPRDQLRILYRRAVRIHHPDAGGSAGDWSKLDEARQVIERQDGTL